MVLEAGNEPFQLRPLVPADRHWIRGLVAERWGAPFVVARATVYYPDHLPGFVAADQSDHPIGLVTYHILDNQCEIVTLDSLIEGHGVGSELLLAVRSAAEAAGCRRVWLVTTNDNLQALRFYQKRGFLLVTIHRNAVLRSREIKPSIPLIGANGIAIRDEIELELLLSS